MPRKVLVQERDIPIKSYVNKNLDIEKVGIIHTRKYEGEEVFRNSFRPILSVDHLPMKPTSKEWVPLQHTEVIDPLIELGWEIRSIGLRKHGRVMSAVLTHPDGEIFKDPFKYDKGTWGNTDEDGNKGLTQSVFLKHQILPGRGLLGLNGFFRYICSNGLMDSSLELGKVRYNSTTWDPNMFTQELFRDTLTEDLILGEMIGNKASLGKYIKFIDDFRLQQDLDDYMRNLPPVARKYTKALDKLPEWMLNGIHTDLQKLNGSGLKEYHRGHIINSTTNAINLGMIEDETRSRGSADSKIESFVNSASDLMGAYSL